MKRLFFYSFVLLAVIGQKDVIACNKSLAHTRYVSFGVRQSPQSALQQALPYWRDMMLPTKSL